MSTATATMHRFLIRYHQGQPDDHPKAAEALTFEGACRQCGWDPAECTGQMLKLDAANKDDWEDVDTTFIPDHFSRRPAEAEVPWAQEVDGHGPAPAATPPARRARKVSAAPTPPVPSPAAAPAAQGITLPLSSLQPNPWQPPSRLKLSDEGCQKGAADVLANGLIYAIVVRRNKASDVYEVADGWQRVSWYKWLAAQPEKPAEYQTIPAVVRDLTDEQMSQYVWSANVQRRNMTPIDLAWYYKRQLADFHLTQTALAHQIGISQPEIANTIRLLDLPDVIQTQVSAGEISSTIGLTLLQVKNEKKRREYAQQAVNGKLTVADLDKTIKDQEWTASKSLSLDTYDDKPVFDLTPCANCEHMVMLNPGYGGQKASRCNDLKCWNGKQKEAIATQQKAALDKLAAHGITRLVGKDELKRGEFLHFYESPREDKACPTCEKRAAQREGDHFHILCLDPQCGHAKRQAEDDRLRATAEAKQHQHEEQERAAIEQSCAGADVRDESTILLTIECLLRSRQSRSVLALLDLKTDPKTFRSPTLKQMLAAVAKHKLDAYHLLPRLAFACLKDQTYDEKQTAHMLARFAGQTPAETPAND